MTLYQGWYPEVTLAQKGRNITARLIEAVGREKAREIANDLIAKHDGLNSEFIREYNFVTMEMEK